MLEKPHKLRSILLVSFLIEMQLPDKTQKNRNFQWKNQPKKKKKPRSVIQEDFKKKKRKKIKKAVLKKNCWQNK